MKDLKKLETLLGVSFKNQAFLQSAMTHRSYLNENPDYSFEHNERLEFLGDAVLELAVTEYLYARYPNPEGDLTNWRAALVNAKMLAAIARELGIGSFLLLSKGEAKDEQSKARDYILANAMEAIIGAIYLESGYAGAGIFVEKHILTHLPDILENKLYQDAKSLFQEIAQREVGITPTYKVLSEEGPDHAKIFEIGVYLKQEMIATGQGTSKQEAQLVAAANALKAKNWTE